MIQPVLRVNYAQHFVKSMNSHWLREASRSREAVSSGIHLHVLTLFLIVLLLAAAGAHAEPASQRQSREETLKRMSAETGVAAASTPSYSSAYPQRIRDAIRSNVLLPEAVEGNPIAEVQVRTRPDGTIASFALIRSSGSAAWDAAVLQAVEKTGRIPRDVSGAVPPVLVLAFRPK